MSSKGSGTVIVRMSDPKLFTPKLTVRVTSVKDKPHTFLLQIIHPNKTEGVIDPKTGEFAQDKRTGRFKKIGKILHSEEVVNKNPDQLKAFLEVKAKGDSLVRNEYADVKTAHEDILFIPAAKKGKMKMKTKEAAQKGLEEDYSNGNSVIDEDVELISDDDFGDDGESLDTDISEIAVNIPEDLDIKTPSLKKEPKSASKVKKTLKTKEKIKNKVKNNTKVKKTKKTKAKNNKNKGKR